MAPTQTIPATATIPRMTIVMVGDMKVSLGSANVDMSGPNVPSADFTVAPPIITGGGGGGLFAGGGGGGASGAFGGGKGVQPMSRCSSRPWKAQCSKIFSQSHLRTSPPQYPFRISG
eukprot:scaffold128839_cov30-Tisochrysis_lutea.AAC.2